jgi:hypothetical protein
VHLLVPLILMACLASTSFIWPSIYKRLVIEDGAVEYATVGVYLVGFVWGLGLVRKLNAKRELAWTVVYAGLSFGFLLIALEEISWGQRIFGLETPEFFKGRNIQGEIGVHNLSSLRLLLSPAYIAIGFGGAFGSLILSRLGVPARIFERLLPPPHLFLYFVPCFIFYLSAEIISPFTTIRYTGELGALYGGKLADPRGVLALPAHLLDVLRDWVPMWSGVGGKKFTLWRHQEPAEFLLSLGFLFFVVFRSRKE